MPKKNPHLQALDRIARALPKARPLKVYELLQNAFLIFAAAGDVDRAEAVVRLVYTPGRPPPPDVVYAFGTGTMDGFLHAAARADLTRGVPSRQGHGPAHDADLATRVGYWAAVLLQRLTMDHYTQFPPPAAPWQTLEERELWRAAQVLARPETDGAPSAREPEALLALTKYLEAWACDPTARTACFGESIILGLDLALRLEGRAPSWFAPLARHVVDPMSRMHDAFCVPSVAKAIVGGLLRDAVAFGSDAERAAALARLVEATPSTPATKATVLGPGKTLRREVDCDFNQFHLEHRSLMPATPYFQDRRESAQGMSIFVERVGVATPVETGTCATATALAEEAPEVPRDAVQAVAFPLEVRGPLVVRGVDSTTADDDPFEPPRGAYDVLVVFRAKKANARTRPVLRSFDVTMTFCPRGSLGAPTCTKLEEGTPPASVYMNERG